MRADLIEKSYSLQAPRHLGFAIACGVASTFATLLVLFVVNPTYPQKINALIKGKQITQQANTQLLAPLPSARKTLADSASLENASHDFLVPNEETDRRIVESFMANQIPGRNLKLQSGISKGVYSIREFIAEDGKRVLVYTQIDKNPKKEPIPASY